MTVGHLVLAAGSSRRAGPTNKLLVPVEGVPMVRRAVETTLQAGGPVWVVTGHERARIEAALVGLSVEFVHNGAHADGMGSSIAAGIGALGRVDGALILLGDMPFVCLGTLRRLIAVFEANPERIVAPVAGTGNARRRGNPVVWPQAWFGALQALTGDVGGRRLLRGRPNAVLEVDVADPGVLLDIDTLEAGRARPPD